MVGALVNTVLGVNDTITVQIGRGVNLVTATETLHCLQGIQRTLIVTVGGSIAIRVFFRLVATTDTRVSRFSRISGTSIVTVGNLISVRVQIGRTTTTLTAVSLVRISITVFLTLVPKIVVVVDIFLITATTARGRLVGVIFTQVVTVVDFITIFVCVNGTAITESGFLLEFVIRATV